MFKLKLYKFLGIFIPYFKRKYKVMSFQIFKSLIITNLGNTHRPFIRIESCDNHEYSLDVELDIGETYIIIAKITYYIQTKKHHIGYAHYISVINNVPYRSFEEIQRVNNQLVTINNRIEGGINSYINTY